nr:hypothetical protein Iba_chr06aCG5670 [Ipomoea batatas]
MVKLFSNHCQQRIQPAGVGFPLLKGHCPLSSISTDGIFPFWLDFILETMEVCPYRQLARMVYIIVNTPKIFNGGESIDGLNIAAPSGLFGLGRGVIKPEGPRVL